MYVAVQFRIYVHYGTHATKKVPTFITYIRGFGANKKEAEYFSRSANAAVA